MDIQDKELKQYFKLFTARMKLRLMYKEELGFTGWNESKLYDDMRERFIEKVCLLEDNELRDDDFLDIANFAMFFLYHHNQKPKESE